MSFNSTHPGLDWLSDDDLTQYGRHVVLEFAIPGLVSALSFLYFVWRLIYRNTSKKYIALSDQETQNLLAENENDDGGNAYGAIKDEQELDVTSRHFDIKRLLFKNEDGSDHGHVQYVYRSFGERLRVALEEVLIVFNVALTLGIFFLPDLHREYSDFYQVVYVKLFIWTYALLICSIRLVNLNKQGSPLLPNLWKQSVLVYSANFLTSALTFRSALIGNVETPLAQKYYVLVFITSSILTLSVYTAQIGDKPARVYVPNNGIVSSPEPKTSLLSLMIYSWIDPMITYAYRSSLKMSEVWGLHEDDYAFNVVQKFESIKSTYKFAGRLIKYFKYLLLVQAGWTGLDAVLEFAPSILLKKILEYVEDQETTPKSLAWLFVFLLLFFKLASATTSGRSLFLGRRLCVRLKAIIIGEVYAKALRRKLTIEQVSNDPQEADDTDKNSVEETVNAADDSSALSSSSGSSSADAKKPSADLGSIINLMAVDSFKVSEVSGYLHYFVSAFLMIIIGISLLYSILGWSALLGAGALVLCLPLNYKMASFLGYFQKKLLAITDKRIQKLNEAFQSIRIVKFFGWEDQFAKNILEVRNQELAMLKTKYLVWTLATALWVITPTLICLVSFYCYIVIDGNTLTAPVAFTSLSLFNMLRNPLDQLADMSSFVVQAKVSIDRIQEFLDEEDTSKYKQLSHPRGPDSPLIGFENATFGWSKSSPEGDFRLRDLNIKFREGKLNVIIGATGSGKTSLLLALLGEMELLEGHVYLPGTEPRDELVPDPETGLSEAVAYCSQAAWLLNDTIKNNIVFALPFDQARYDAVIKSCGLLRDLEILDNGDQTEVGEKGITLSGGQKQRVSLARALYSNARHVLLDDCLSAVDSHTALWIYENCITGDLMKGRTCVLVSHNIALTVTEAEWVVVLENGRVKNQGTPDVLLLQGDLGDDEMVKTSVMSRVNSSANLADKKNKIAAEASKIEAKLKDIVAEENALQEQAKPVEAPPKSKLVEEETKSDGVVKFKVYSEYMKDFGSPFIWAAFVFFMFATQGVYMYQSWWLKKWSTAALEPANHSSFSVSNVVLGYQPVQHLRNYVAEVDWHKPLGGETFRVYSSDGAHSTLFYISIYSLIGVLYTIVSCSRVVIVFFGGITASRAIFERMLFRVLRARLRFFDSTPIGRIMNRFSKDIESIDQEITPCGEGFLMCLVQCLAVIVLICSITPAFFFFAIFVLFLYYLIGVFYLAASRELKRYDSITRSPIHQHFTETLVGVPTIRAYGDERRFMLQNLSKIDENNRPFFYLWVANRWLAWRVDFVGALISFVAGVLILVSVERIDAGLAGLSLSYAIAFTDSALWVVRLYAMVEMNMNSAERLQEYMEIEQEPPSLVPGNEPPASWPDKGVIEVSDLSLRYAPDLPRVIKNVSFNVKPNEKVGIVGRTGAGKSTIITAFFRFLDPETGYIKIDGIDITQIGLKNLRQGITIIPQDPTLFTGTIRSNLDMFNEYSDYEIYVALKRVNLLTQEELEAIQLQTRTDASGENVNKFLNLETAVSEGGSNLSQGQRQLMCLARSLLKAPKVILLDEATASIDYLSDAKIQQTIRDEFSGSTILTIAHRLRSIIDYDKILVMDAGEVVEYDHPYSLIINKDSLFYSMCKDSGEVDVLIQLAKEAFVKSKSNSAN